MTYEDALIVLAAGREVCRSCWHSDTRLGLGNHPAGVGVAIYWRGRTVLEGLYQPSNEDRGAIDWQIVRDPALSGEPEFAPLVNKRPDFDLEGAKFDALTGGQYAKERARGAYADELERAQTAAEKALKASTTPAVEIAHAFDDLLDSVDQYLGPRLSTERAYFEARLREAKMWALHHVEQGGRETLGASVTRGRR